MIFVTVGSTYFDELIRETDRLVAEDFFGEEVLCQIGSGTYIPRSSQYFRFANSLESYVNSCRLLITHGGMTVLEALWRNKPLVAVANKNLAGNHQASYLKRLSETFGVIWTDDPSQLRFVIESAKACRYQFTEPHISSYIKTLIPD